MRANSRFSCSWNSARFGVVMRKVSDAILDAPALGDIFKGCRPSATWQRPVRNLDRASIGGLQNRLEDLSLRHFAKERGAICIHIAFEGSDFLAMIEKVLQGAARLHHLGGYTEHLDIALI